MTFLSHRTKLILAFSIIYFVWGATFFGVHLALKSFPPFLLSALRLLIAGSALALFCVARKEPLPSLADTRTNALAGVAIFIGGILFVVWAQQYLSSSLAASIISTPFWFILLDKPQWKFYFSSRWIVGGLLLSLVGVIMLMSFKTGRPGVGDETMKPIAILVMILGSGLWVAGSLFMRYRPGQSSVYVNTSTQLLSAGVVALLLSYVTGDLQKFSHADVLSEAVWALFYLGLVSSMLGFLAFMWLISVQPPAIVSTYAYVNPLVAAVLGWAFAGEHISGVQILALGIILTGVFFVNVPRYRASLRQ